MWFISVYHTDLFYEKIQPPIKTVGQVTLYYSDSLMLNCIWNLNNYTIAGIFFFNITL